MNIFTDDNIIVPSKDDEKIRILMMKFNYTRIEAQDIIRDGLYENAVNED